MSGTEDAPLVLRFTAPRLALLLVAVGLLLALGTCVGYRLGRQLGPATAEVAPSTDDDAPVLDAEADTGEGFEASVDLGSGYALVYLRTGSADEARRARDELAGRDLPVRIDQDARRRADDRFRVLVGPFPDRADALEAAGSLGRSGSADVVFLE